MNMVDKEDRIDDDGYFEFLERNQTFNFYSYNPNEHLDLDDDEKLELYNIFIQIEKSLQKGGKRKKKRKTNRKRKINKWKKSKTKKRKPNKKKNKYY